MEVKKGAARPDADIIFHIPHTQLTPGVEARISLTFGHQAWAFLITASEPPTPFSFMRA